MLQRYLITCALILWASLSWSACKNHKITEPANVRIDGDAVMIVVHQSATYDARYSTKRGVDEATRFAKANNIPLIYLQDDTPDEYYFMADCHPDYWVYSGGGEITFEVTASHLYIVGGHLEHCMSTALHDIIHQWARRGEHDYKVTYFMDAIYSNGKMIDPSDPFYNDFQRFLSVVTYGRPGGEHWPKLSLLESLGIIQKEEHRWNYIKQILPRWDTTFPEQYEIRLAIDNSLTEILRPARGWTPPSVTFHFVSSAIEHSTPTVLRR